MLKKVVIMAVFLIVFISGCDIEEKEIVETGEPTWNVYKGEKPVLEFQNKSGHIVTTRSSPDIYIRGEYSLDNEAVKHPFLNARNLLVDMEDELLNIIENSTSFEEFLSLLEENGYTIKEIEPNVFPDPWELTCSQLCEEEGHPESRCGSAPVLPNAPPECESHESDVGSTFDCNSKGVTGATSSCCCIVVR